MMAKKNMKAKRGMKAKMLKTTRKTAAGKTKSKRGKMMKAAKEA